MKDRDSTDINLFIKNLSSGKTVWNRMRLISQLLSEADMTKAKAEILSREIENTVLALGSAPISTQLMDAIITSKLEEHGFKKSAENRSSFSVQLKDIEKLIFYPNRRKASQHHSPEGTNLLLAEALKAEYALKKVFSPAVAEAHLSGDIHVHQLGSIDRPLNSYNSIELIKKTGLALPGFNNCALPAKHAEVLIAQIVRFSVILQGHYSGTIGWHALNVLIAPFLEGMKASEIKQLAQILIFELAQMASPKGAQSVHCELHVYPDVPEYLADINAIGPGGVNLDKCYADFRKEASSFFTALVDVLQEGDGKGYPFFLPKFFIHLEKNSIIGSTVINSVCETAVSRGTPAFLIEKNNELFIPGIGSVKTDILDDYEKAGLRRSSLQSVTINLPALALKKSDPETALNSILELSVKAHMEKRVFLEKLMAQGSSGPLSFFALDSDGSPFLDFHSATHLIGINGLDEITRVVTGEGLTSVNGIHYGSALLKKINEKISGLRKLYHLNLVLCQSPAESTAHRFARLDTIRFSPDAGQYVKGDISKGEIYYQAPGFTDSSLDIHPMKKAEIEGSLNRMTDVPSPTNIYIDSCCPPASEIADFIEKVAEQTECSHLTFSPVFTKCHNCGHLSRGSLDNCEKCNSFLVDKFVRITDYYAYLSDCNKGKRGEITGRFMADRYL